MAKKPIREIIPPSDLLVVIMLLKRLFGGNKDLQKLLKRIDEPHELDALYAALETLLYD